MKNHFYPFRLLEIALLFAVVPFWGGTRLMGQDVRSEEAEDYYRKWLDEEVVYIITPEERDIFGKLTTPDEKEQFIEQFWLRRDTDPRTAINEYKEEHYRRVAYVNERYFSGKPGWKTDRGRIYIIHGPPTSIESHPSGGSYQRPMNEGGGTTVAYPFEVWRYRYLEGIGDDILIEFVDQSWTGEYRLSWMPEDKDALLYVPGQGQTLAELEGRATRAERPIFKPGGRDLYPLMSYTYRDNPFYRYEIYSKVNTPVAIKFRDLQELVKVKIDYVNLPVMVRKDHFSLSDAQVLVPITVQLANKDITFEQERGRHVARLGVYGIVTSMGNRVVEEFEDDLVTTIEPADLVNGLKRSSLYQKILVLEAKGRYKLSLVVKDLNSGHLGFVETAMQAPSIDSSKLSASSLVLSDSVRILDQAPEKDEMFVLGDVRVRPSLERRFYREMPLGTYFQLYHVGIDQATQQPSLSIAYRLFSEGKELYALEDNSGEAIQFFSNWMTVVVRQFPLNALEPGEYEIRVEAYDRIREERVELKEQFSLEKLGAELERVELQAKEDGGR